MKKKGIALLTMLALSAALAVSACGGDGGGTDNPEKPPVSGDVYQDYDPQKQPGGDSFEYDGNYASPELVIDGKGDDKQWQAIEEPLFRYGKNDAVSVKAYRGERALFFLFEVKDTVLLTQGVTNDDAVTHGDSIEFYIDTKADGGRAPQSDDFQINLGIHGKTRIMQGAGGQWGIWNGLIDYEVDLNGTLNDGDTPNDTGYTVEVMVQYKDILIEKDDTIGFAVGQVDKIRTEDAPNGNNDGNHGPWDWFGWSRVRDPQVPDSYVLLQADGTIISRDEQKKPPADLAGTVKDTEGNAVAGATAKVLGKEERTATTDENGYFCFEDFDPEETYTVTVEKEGYLAGTQTYTRDELRAANGGKVVKDIVLIPTATLRYTTLTGTVKNVADGAIGGATVTVKGTQITATALQDGTFTLSEVPANNGDVTLVVSKEGYADSETTVKEADLQTGGTTALGDVNLSLPWADMGMFAGKSNFFVASATTLTRTLTGIQVRFEGLRRLSGHIEFYLDTKTSETDRNQDSTAWCFRLKDDGTVEGDHYTTSFSAQGLIWTVLHNDSDGFVGEFFVPYSYLGISPLEVFGVEFGQWSTSANDWDGWTNCPVGTAPVAENPTTWMRVGLRNNLYRAEDNATKAAFSGTVTSGGKGVAGVTVEANGARTTTDGSGKWKMEVTATSEKVTVTYTAQGYVTATTEIEAGYLNSHAAWSEEKTLSERKITLSGKVSDQDGHPLGQVQIRIEELGLDTETDEQGDYTFEDVTTFEALTVKFSLEGYAEGTEKLTLEKLNEGDTVTLDKALTATAQVKTTTLTGTVKNVADGAVGGATVTVKGTQLKATTSQDGTFSIEGLPVNDVDVTLVISKEGYADSETTVQVSALQPDGTTALGDINLSLPWADAQYFGTGSDKTEDKRPMFANFHAQINRTLTGIVFRFDGERKMTPGKVELYLDTKESADRRENDATCWRFDLNENGTVTGDHFAGGAFTAEGLVYTIVNGEDGCHLTFFIPYSYLGIAGTEVFGISLGQWSDTASDWNGWEYEKTFVAPETPKTYRRISARNEIYTAESNALMVKLSGNAGQENVTVKVNTFTTMTDASGDWSLDVPLSGDITVTYSKQGYVSRTTTIPEDTFGGGNLTWSENVTLTERKITLSGKVTDQDGAPVHNVQVKIEELDRTVLTNEQGEYTFEDVTAFEAFTLTFTCEGYADGSESLTLEKLNEGDAITLNKTLTATEQVKKLTLTGKIVGIEGGIEGATLKLKDGDGTLASAAADGVFSIEDFTVVDCTLVISKEGYLDREYAFHASAAEDAEGSFSAGDIFLTRDYTALGAAFGTKSDDFASFVPYVTRGETAFLFRFVGSKAFFGRIEVFVDTKLSAGIDGRNATDYRFDLNKDGAIGIDNFGGSNTDASTLTLHAEGADTASPVVTFTLPYAFLGVARDEIIGVTFGQWSTTANGNNGDWDGWNVANMLGANGEAFVKPEMPWDYIRIGLDNLPFENSENKTKEELDLTGYNVHFGKALDSLHAKVSRDETGVTFEFITLGDFGIHDDTNSDYVLIYFDIGEVSGGWDGVDYLIKIDKDGNVYGQKGAWWPAGDGNKIGNISISRDGGITRFSYKAEYTTVGITGGQSEVFGFTLVEGWKTAADNGSNEYGGCLFTKEAGHYIVADAAAVSGYIRVKADGTLTTANSNAEAN